MALETERSEQSNTTGLPATEARFLEELRHDPKAFYSSVKNVFDRVDTDHSGTLTKLEIGNFINDSNTKPQEKAAARIVEQHFDDFKHLAEPILHEPRWPSEFAARRVFGDNMDNTAISRKDFDVFNISFADRNKLQQAQDEFARGEKTSGAILNGGIGALIGTMAFAIAACDVEPISKAALIGLAVGLGTGFGFQAMEPKPSTILIKEADQRRKMIESWQFFEPR